ncbi:hypothetical protein EPO66_02900 [bacterium]|nr:MAG: hypothetical protein EPO66_02900 [bacterium]
MKKLNIKELYAFIGRMSKREKAVFYAAVIFVSVMILDRIVISPITGKMRALDNEIRQKETSIKKNLHILAQKDRILMEGAKYAMFLNSSKSEEEEMTSLLKEIENIANKASVYLIDMKPVGVKTSGLAQRYEISLSCEGQMEQIVDFMYGIESSRELLVISRYQVSPKSRESSVAKASLAISKVVIP